MSSTTRNEDTDELELPIEEGMRLKRDHRDQVARAAMSFRPTTTEMFARVLLSIDGRCGSATETQNVVTPGIWSPTPLRPQPRSSTEVVTPDPHGGNRAQRRAARRQSNRNRGHR